MMTPILIRHAQQIKSNDSKNSLTEHQISTHLQNPCLVTPILIQILIQSIDNLKIQESIVAIKVSSIWNKGVQLNTLCGVVLGNETTFFLLSHFGEKPRATACYNMRTTTLYNTLTNDMHFYIVNTFQKVPLEVLLSCTYT